MTDYTELKRLAEAHAQKDIADPIESKRVMLVEPKTVLALIAENERLAKQWGDRPAYRTPEYESKRDAMWRRAHMVATSKGYDHINMAIAAAPQACADCMGCGGEWQGDGAPNSVCETCNGSRGKSLEVERDQLKAENEALRKHQPSAEVIWCACGDGHAANSYGAGFMDANNGVCENCDAASGGYDLRKDAERYRFVRSIASISAGRRYLVVKRRPVSGFSSSTARDFDSAIDAAMGQGERS
ncbi:hypothetical protein K0P33_17090 [Pseudomonas sp. ArH3a]|uniref:hypothetical protein n=1 Tax=Pseudomonas sp. ArH3a TaxID=2862945 RepID=UPI001F5A38D4|nr:hypothetical protein [Pseudomonas sp. ArH3a]UNM17299.1 hypothetical protein K0P33_17090 [Pseudomonas sp. ArH3a]